MKGRGGGIVVSAFACQEVKLLFYWSVNMRTFRSLAVWTCW